MSSSAVTKWTVIITGASRGFGKATAIALQRRLVEQTNLSMHLIARSEAGLHDTQSSLNPKHTAYTHCMDLSNLDTLQDKWTTFLQEHIKAAENADDAHHNVVMIHNAGSLGYTGPTRDAGSSSSLQSIQQTINLNLTSMIYMTNTLVEAISTSTNMSITLHIVQISSLAAIQPLPTMAIYSANKAARNAYIAAWSKEHDNDATKDNKSDHCNNVKIRLLNYAPGPLETEIMTELRNNEHRLDKTMIQPMTGQQQLDPMTSAKVLVDILLNDEYENGAHIDYYDVTAKKGT